MGRLTRITGLPEEIISEILTRLPVESALDCKLVCKPWRDLVRRPSFSRMHSKHLNENDSGDKGYGHAYICNPITRECISLPNHPRDCVWNGFGYCPSTDEYKVVRICVDSNDPDCGIAEVYTLGSGGNVWRNVGEIGPNWKNMEEISISGGVFANGALHWVNRDNGAILAFDLTDEKFSELPSPPYMTRDGVLDFPIHLGVLGDFLSATYNPADNGSEIWLLKEKNKDDSDLSWSKEFHFNSYIELSLEFRKSGRLLCYGFGETFSYNSNASSAKMDVALGMVCYAVIPHKHTLLSLKALGEKDTKTMEFDEKTRSSQVLESST